MSGRELWRLRLNIFVLLVLNFTTELGYESTLPTIHQYLTNPTEELNGTKAYPGFGQSEFVYSIAVSMHSVGNLVSPIVGQLIIWIPYFYGISAGIVLATLSNILYGTSQYAWMIHLSRLLQGMAYSIVSTLSLVYIGSKESYYNEVHAEHCNARARSSNKEVKPVKDTQIKKIGYTLLQFSTALTFIVGPGVSSLIAQFPSVNLFRWIGYFNTILCGLSVMFLVTLFRGEYKLVKSEVKKDGGSPLPLKTWRNLISDDYIKVVVLAFLLSVFIIFRSFSEILYTLISPILSASFGLTEKEISYYFTGLLAVYVLGSFIVVLIGKRFNPRIALFILFLLLCISCAAIADWQTIGKDPCKIYSPFDNSSFSVSAICKQDNLSQSVLHYCTSVDSSDYEISLAAKLCQSKNECQWNQVSFLSKVWCLSCPPICRRVKHSLNFIQFTVGASVLVSVLPLGKLSIFILVSNNFREYNQGPFIGAAIALGGISSALLPLLLDHIYEKSQKRTFPLMAANMVLCVLVLMGLTVLYRVLDPKDVSKEESKATDKSEKELLLRKTSAKSDYDDN